MNSKMIVLGMAGMIAFSMIKIDAAATAVVTTVRPPRPPRPCAESLANLIKERTAEQSGAVRAPRYVFFTSTGIKGAAIKRNYGVLDVDVFNTVAAQNPVFAQGFLEEGQRDYRLWHTDVTKSLNFVKELSGYAKDLNYKKWLNAEEKRLKRRLDHAACHTPSGAIPVLLRESSRPRLQHPTT